jgi:CDGSH-type Zn-finger protein
MAAHIAAKFPAVLELGPGTYWWCACGLSKSQPWCDGSHAGSGMQPMKYELTEGDVGPAGKKKVAMCQCKATAHAPMCDGRHKTL